MLIISFFCPRLCFSDGCQIEARNQLPFLFSLKCQLSEFESYSEIMLIEIAVANSAFLIQHFIVFQNLLKKFFFIIFHKNKTIEIKSFFKMLPFLLEIRLFNELRLQTYHNTLPFVQFASPMKYRIKIEMK